MGIFANTAIRESYGWAPDELSDVKLLSNFIFGNKDKDLDILLSGLLSITVIS